MASSARAKVTAAMKAQANQEHGRSLPELLEANDVLSGVESARLRSWFTTECMEPHRDLDAYGKLLFTGDLVGIKADFEKRVRKHKAADPDASNDTSYVYREAAAEELFSLAWGPTGVRIYGLLALARRIVSDSRIQAAHLAVATWLVNDAGVPMDGCDLSGTTALSQSISTKPLYDPELAEILLSGGADINHRNRYGATSLHEAVLIFMPTEEQRANTALQFYLSHGGNVDIAEGDGVTCRTMITKMPRRSMIKTLQDEDRRRKLNAGSLCSFCGKNDNELELCPEGCGKARYCTSRRCRKGDLAHHKPSCKPAKK